MVEQTFSIIVAMTHDELNDLMIRKIGGQTLCRWANRLHHDLLFSEPGRIVRLAETLLAAERKPKKFTKKAMQEALHYATDEGCYAANLQSAHWECEERLGESRWRRFLSRFDGIRGAAANWIANLLGKR